MPLISRIEQGFVRQLEPLTGETRQLLLLAAAEPVGDVTLLRRAAELLGIGADEAALAEATGLIDIGARVRFRHPLVRSAAYRAASRAGPPARPWRAGRRDRSAARSRSAGMASRPCRRASRRDRGRRAGALRRACAGSWGHRRGGRLPRASGRADPRSGPSRWAGAGRRAGQVRRRRARHGRSSSSRPPRSPRSTTFSARCLDRLRAQITFARTRGSERSCAAARRRQASRRVRCRAGARDLPRSVPSDDLRRSPRRRRPGRGRGRPRGAPGIPDAASRWTSCSMAWPRGSPRVTQQAWHRSGERLTRSRRRTGPARTTCAGCGWRAPSHPSPSHPISGTTSHGIG